MLFLIDKGAKNLVLKLDAGHSPRKEGIYQPNKELKIKLDR